MPLPLPGETAVETAKRLQDLIDSYGRIFLVSHNAEQVDPDGSIEVWLAPTPWPPTTNGPGASA